MSGSFPYYQQTNKGDPYQNTNSNIQSNNQFDLPPVFALPPPSQPDQKCPIKNCMLCAATYGAYYAQSNDFVQKKNLEYE